MSELVASFSRLVETSPHRRLIDLPAAGRTLTTTDIWDLRTSQTATLRACGLRAGDLLLLAVGNRPSFVSLFLAARELGLAVLAVDGGTTSAELRELSARFGAKAIATVVEHAADLGPLKATLADGLAVIGSETQGAPIRYPGVAMLRMTSGSSGLPKATSTTEAQLIVDGRQIIEAMGIGPDDTQIAVIPLSHAYGATVVMMPLLLQGTPMVLRESFVPHQLPADAVAGNARVFPGVPFMFEYFLNHPPVRWPQGLRTLISAGARLTSETVLAFHNRFGVKIHSFYGTSETGGIAYEGSDDLSAAGTVGRPLPAVTITLRPEEDAPPGAGRVHVSGGAVSNGYVGEAAGEFSDGGFLTGDYGMFDAAGRLVLTGRASSFINVAGKKVQPGEVEDVLRRMPGIRDVRVLAAADPQRGEQVAAIVVADPAGPVPTTVAVRRFCSTRLAPFKIPRVIVALDAIPLTARGKVDRRAMDEAIRGAIASFPEQLC